jgi:hypothetical protein
MHTCIQDPRVSDEVARQRNLVHASPTDA